MRKLTVAPGRLAVGAGLAVAVALCGVGGWSYAQARGDDSLAYGRARDAALADGRTGIAALSTLDASTLEKAKAGARKWTAVTTGALRTEIERVEPATGPSSRGVVTDAAVTALDDRAGTAKVIATVRIDITSKGATAPSTDRKRLEAVLARESDGSWKIKALNAVPVTEPDGASGENG
ncbi:hypothetical protein ACIQNU_30485 [Streptomyces sp. NPDC091292]|uniref:hypothetical protein n=1 Tax=Streptomyces sp. NPDC091292 TaxID=3365991 RepID=UPI0038281780